MIFKRVKLWRGVTFMKYLADVVSLIFLPKTLIWNKITFRISNSMKFGELMVNEFTESVSKKNLLAFLFPFDLSLLVVKISRTYD